MHKLLFLFILISCSFSYAQTQKEKIFEESYSYAHEIVTTAVRNLSLKMEKNAEYRARNQDILNLYKKVEDAIRTKKHKARFTKEDNLDFSECVDHPGGLANTQVFGLKTGLLPAVRLGVDIMICQIFFEDTPLQRANTIIHEFLHFVSIDDECATDIQTNLILYFAGLPPQKDGYYEMCEFEDFYKELNRKLK